MTIQVVIHIFSQISKKNLFNQLIDQLIDRYREIYHNDPAFAWSVPVRHYQFRYANSGDCRLPLLKGGNMYLFLR